MEFFLSPLPLRCYCVAGSQATCGLHFSLGITLINVEFCPHTKYKAARSIFRLTTMEVVRWQLTKKVTYNSSHRLLVMQGVSVATIGLCSIVFSSLKFMDPTTHNVGDHTCESPRLRHLQCYAQRRIELWNQCCCCWLAANLSILRVVPLIVVAKIELFFAVLYLTNSLMCNTQTAEAEKWKIIKNI